MTPTPADALEVFLQPGEFYFGEEKTRIRTLLGSCVAITLWHPRLRIGGMAHYMLPSRPGLAKGQPLDGRYAEEVLWMFQRELQSTRTRSSEYQVKLFGGGRMFAHVQKAKRHVDVSDRNVVVGRELMSQHGFRIVAEDLGGDGHRSVVFDLWSGDVWLKKTAKILSGSARERA
jgi:chemotaxis protein CheD